MFVHLHTHSHYSLLDGLSQIGPLVNRAKELEMPALALTDHGNMYGAIEFYNACLEAEIKPILGMEAYVSTRGMEDRQGKTDADYFHLTLLAKSYEGYLNLISLSSEGHLRGFYYKPKVDKATLKKYSKGLIALSGCPRGEVPRAVLSSGGLLSAKKVLEEYLDIFGRENFYLEIQRGYKDSKNEDGKKFSLMNRGLVQLAKETGVGLVATQDSHYIFPEDSEAQDILVCIGTGRTVDSSDRLDMRGSDLSLRSPQEMQEIFADLPEALHNTLKIAETCDVQIPLNQRYFALVDIPEGDTNESFLTKQVDASAKKKFGDPLPPEVKTRLDYEMEIICEKGFAPYFLMVADIAEGARNLGAIVTTRGSAAGSLVGFVLNISTIDPLEFGLPFERFLTKSRPTPPDIDLDISDKDRDSAIAWITEKYGKDKVAQIITFGTMQARAAVRDCGRALGFPYGKCDRLAKLIPVGKQGFNMTLAKALEISPELLGAYEKDPEARKILDAAKRIEGNVRHASIHAAAVVITPSKLTDYTPLQKEPGGERIITQYDMYSLDLNADSKAIGVIKMDLLGISNLSTLRSAVNLVEKRRGIKLDIYNLPHPDQKAFELLSKGHTFGIFQLGGGGMTKNLKELKPSSIFDISAMVALYRPGPMAIIPEYIARKNDPSKVKYFDPRMESYLQRSLGLLVYQEDVLLTAIHIAGYSWEEADKLRKAMGKKIPAEMAKQKIKFIDGAVAGGMEKTRAEELFGLIEPFAAYGFGKAHAASYAQVGYQMAYVKAHFPVEFMASLMTVESGDENKIYEAVEECKAMGIKVLPPDVLESYEDFTVVDDQTIRFGLGAIKNLGSDLVAHLLSHRTTNKTQDNSSISLEEFIIICAPSRGFNKKSWEALVKAGALDRFGERGWLLSGTDNVLAFAKDHQKQSEEKQLSLFGDISFAKLTIPPARSMPERQRLAFEKEHLGLYVTGHPLQSFTSAMSGVMPIKMSGKNSPGTPVTLAGLVTRTKKMLTKKQELMASFTIEDLTGQVEALVFPKNFAGVMEVVAEDRVVKISGKISTEGEDEVKILVDRAESLMADEERKRLTICLDEHSSKEAFWRILQILESFPGIDEVVFSLGHNGENKKMKVKQMVTVSPTLLTSLENISEVKKVEVK